MARFKLNTALRGVGRVKGWRYTSDLRETVASVSAEDKPALIVAIEAQLVKAREALAQAEVDMRNPRCTRNSRFGNKIGARYNRASLKIDELTIALEEIK